MEHIERFRRRAEAPGEKRKINNLHVPRQSFGGSILALKLQLRCFQSTQWVLNSLAENVHTMDRHKDTLTPPREAETYMLLFLRPSGGNPRRYRLRGLSNRNLHSGRPPLSVRVHGPVALGMPSLWSLIDMILSLNLSHLHA